MTGKSMEAGSRYTGKLPRGCALCRKGAKMVLLVTGKCGTACFYCPLSRKKRGRDVVYANELRVKDEEEVLTEARLIDAEGTGITGGDPLVVLDRTLRLIRLLKREFGRDHHVHLYTSTVDPVAFRRLERAGLDELRIHPGISKWKRMEKANYNGAFTRKSMAVGLEVPSIPYLRDDLVSLVTYADRIGLDFVNLNELEFSETNWRRLRARGLEPKDDVSSAAKGSELDLSTPRHYCSSSFKDRVQLRKRIMRRARNVARPGDVITEDGTLLKGIVEGRNRERIREALSKDFHVPDDLMFVDEEKRRVEIAPWILEEIAASLTYDAFIVEEYPTADRLEVERERLSTRPRRR